MTFYDKKMCLINVIKQKIEIMSQNCEIKSKNCHKRLTENQNDASNE